MTVAARRSAQAPNVDGGGVLYLNDCSYFVQVVDRSRVTAAGRTLRIPKSMLSHRIRRHETELAYGRLMANGPLARLATSKTSGLGILERLEGALSGREARRPPGRRG